jgi:hypothetical protein
MEEEEDEKAAEMATAAVGRRVPRVGVVRAVAVVVVEEEEQAAEVAAAAVGGRRVVMMATEIPRCLWSPGRLSFSE